MSSDVKIQIPDELINTIAQAKIAEVLGKKDELIAAVVHEVFSMKKDRYSNKTLFTEQVEQALRDTALEVWQEWLENNKEEVRLALLHELTTNKSKRVKEIVERIIEQMTKWTIHVNLRMPNDDC